MEAEGRHEPVSSGEWRPQPESVSKCPTPYSGGAVGCRFPPPYGTWRRATSGCPIKKLKAIGVWRPPPGSQPRVPADGLSPNQEKTDAGLWCNGSKSYSNELAINVLPMYISVHLSNTYHEKIDRFTGIEAPLVGVGQFRARRQANELTLLSGTRLKS
jgi:hypothetical protein